MPEVVASNLLVFRGCPYQWAGYGMALFALTAALLRRGLHCYFDRDFFRPLPGGEAVIMVPEWATRRALVPPEDATRVHLGAPPWRIADDARDTVFFTMWESSRLPRECVRALNACRAVLVPSRWNQATFSASGVEAPIAVVPLGVDPTTFTPGERPGRAEADTFTVGMAGRMSHGGCRKGIVEGLVAWRKAFDGRRDVRLEVKCLADDPVPDFGDPRITIHRGYWTDDVLAAWYRGLDLFFHPSRAEGWGCHLLEAMACGTPVMTVLWSGETEFCNPANCFDLPFRLMPAADFYTGHGAWAVPDEEAMVEGLRLLGEHRGLCAERGAIAARSAARYSWDAAAERFAQAMEQLG